MTKETRKRLEEAAREYADEYVVGDATIIAGLTHEVAKECFLAGEKYGYKEAIAQAKKWLKDNLGHYDYNVVYIGETRWEHIAKDFEADMNKLWEGER